MKTDVRAILLCAGKGTRMNDPGTHKVCQKILGVPVVVRLIDSLRAAGISQFTVVVGHLADQVMDCLKNEKGVSFAYQDQQRGTADAVLCGLTALRKEGYRGRVLICMGDKLVSPACLSALLAQHTQAHSDLSFLTQTIDANPSGGRVISREGHFYALLERMDEARLKLLWASDRSDTGLRQTIETLGFTEKKAQKLFEVAQEDAHKGRRTLPAPLSDLTPEDLAGITDANTAFYLWESAAEARSALGEIGTDNAQGEFYLTDALTLAARRGARVTPLRIEEKDGILSYSTMEELMAIEAQMRQQTSAHLRPASVWIQELENGRLDAKLFEIYGPQCDPAVRRAPYLHALDAFLREYGDRNVLISRAPGRVNLMGRHIEHRGGSTNILAIDRESIAVVSPRPDDVVHLANTDPAFPKTCFSISQTIAAYDTADWVEFIESEKILESVSQTRGDWANYIKAGVLRLQLNDRDTPLCGMDMLFCGNIPIAAGLSSSSSLVVTTMEAAIALNNLELEVEEFVALSGEGEWFVGSRGGAGDHAAMKCGKRGEITHMNFFPFSVGESVPWPEEYDIVVANSGIKAKKSDGARDKFNAMVASYELAFLWVVKEFPQYESKLGCIRDINAKNLGISSQEIYKLLLSIPLSIKTEEIFSLYPSKWHKRIRQVLSSHENFPEYRLRGVLLYGLAECARADHCIHLLKAGDYERLGELMCISHNGDRVWQNGAPFFGQEDDEYLSDLIDGLNSSDPARREASSLYNQPGVYACSTKEIDMLIDYIISREGVLGAQLSGAGLGGCVIALVRHDHTERLINSLNQIYYKVRGLEPSANIFTPVAGSLIF